MKNVDAAGLEIGDDYPPRIMGVLNVSEESTYDPSVFDDPAEAARYVDRELIAEGADIVDIGLATANKRFEVLSAKQELDRLDTAVDAIESVSGDAVFSIETRYSEVADAALSRGFDMVNDVCGFADPEMPVVCREHDAAVVKMASPPDLERPGAIEKVDDIYAALHREGLTEKTIVDPAFGGWSEAKTLEDDRETFRQLREFRSLGQPILVSINRKNFLGDVVGRETEDRLPASLAATAMAVERGVHVIRTHDVMETVDAAKIGAEFRRDLLREQDDSGQPTVEELDITSEQEANRHLDRMGADVDEAATGVVRTYEIGSLSEDDSAILAAAAAESGATFARGPDSSRGLLFGTPAALTRLQKSVTGRSDALVAVLARINESE